MKQQAQVRHEVLNDETRHRQQRAQRINHQKRRFQHQLRGLREYLRQCVLLVVWCLKMIATVITAIPRLLVNVGIRVVNFILYLRLARIGLVVIVFGAWLIVSVWQEPAPKSVPVATHGKAAHNKPAHALSGR